MATRIYVGKLAYATTQDELQKLFEKHGKVLSAQLIVDRGSNMSKGFGFVEMEEDSAAQAAIKALDGSEFGGRTIVVNPAKPQEDRSHSGGYR